MKKVCSLFLSALISIAAFAQEKKDSSVNGGDPLEQMLDYSRPGKYHQLLAGLTGTFTFKGSHFDWVDSVTSKVVMEIFGTAVRKPFANGRFFITELTTGATLQLPMQDGKMIEGYGSAFQTEGYDNVKNKFQLSYINNHIGSAIAFWEGIYDSTTKAIAFDGEMENVPGMKTKIRFNFIFNDKDHYKWEYYMEQNGKYRKASEMYFTRVEGK